MDTTFVYNIPDVPISDTIKAVVTNMPEKIGLSDDVLSVYDSIQMQLAESNSKIDSLFSILQLRGAEGWGIEQYISIIAIPLIISVFTFSLPLILNATWKMDSLYHSREISRLLGRSWQMIVYVASMAFSLLLLLIWLFFFFFEEYIITMLPYAALAVVVSAALYYMEVRKFSNPSRIMEQLEKRYKREYLMAFLRMKIRDWRLRFRRYIHRKDLSSKNIWDSLIGWNKYNVYCEPDHRYFDRVLSILRFALEANDLILFYTIKSALETRIGDIQMRSLDTDKTFDIHYKEADALFHFYRDAITLVGKVNEPTFQDGIIGHLSLIYGHSQMPVEFNNIAILKSLAQLNGEYGLNVIRKYFSRVNTLYGYIRSMALISNIVGVDIQEKQNREYFCKRQWRWLRDMHFMLCAYWWEKSENKLQSELCPPKKQMIPTDMLPVCGDDFLYQCISTIAGFDTYIMSFPINEVFDMTKESMRELVIRYTAFMLYYTAKREKHYFTLPLDDDMRKCVDAIVPKLKYEAKSEYVQNILALTYLDVTDVDIEKTIDDALKDVMAHDYNKSYEQKPIDDRCRDIQRVVSHCENLLHDPIITDLYREDDTKFKDAEHLKEFTILMSKDFFISSDKNGEKLQIIMNSLGRDMLNRYLYVWLTCITRMRVKDKSWDLANFNHKLQNYQNREENQYVLVSFDSPFEHFWYPRPSDIAIVNIASQVFSLCASTKLYRENSKMAFLIRKDDLPSLQYELGYETGESSIADESSRKDGEFSVRLNINPHLVLRYNTRAEVLRIRCKKIGV